MTDKETIEYWKAKYLEARKSGYEEGLEECQPLKQENEELVALVAKQREFLVCIKCFCVNRENVTVFECHRCKALSLAHSLDLPTAVKRYRVLEEIVDYSRRCLRSDELYDLFNKLDALTPPKENPNG